MPNVCLCGLAGHSEDLNKIRTDTPCAVYNLLMKRVVDAVLRAWCHPVARVMQVVLVGLAGAWLGIVAWDGVRADLKAVTVCARFTPKLAGGTQVALPPFGSIFARTHRGPLRLNLRVDQLHVVDTIEWLQQRRTPEEAGSQFEKEIRGVSQRLIKGTVLVAFVGALVASVVLRLGWRYTLVGLVVGCLGVAVPLGLAVRTYDKSAFSSPRFTGELSRAPFLLTAVQQGYEDAVDKLPVITRQVVDLYRQLEANGAVPGNGTSGNLRALLISDLHNNPLGLRFALDLARSYRVRLILVAGDITDFGHPLESELLSNWTKFTAPVLVVTGNHDSQSIAETLSEVPGVTVLDHGEQVTVAGLTVAGYGDPAARRLNTGNVNASAEDLRDMVQRIKRRMQGENTPDVLMVHNFRVASDVAGVVPVIVTGHSHSASVEQKNGTTLVNAGTTGAQGLRYFTSKNGSSYSAAVLHFSTEGARPRLTTVDLVELRQPSGDFVISRKNTEMESEKAPIPARGADR